MPAYSLILPTCDLDEERGYVFQAWKDGTTLPLAGLSVTMELRRRLSDAAPLGTATAEIRSGGQFRITLPVMAVDRVTALWWRLLLSDGVNEIEIGTGLQPYGVGGEVATPDADEPVTAGYGATLLAVLGGAEASGASLGICDLTPAGLFIAA